jgi:hypothetical protein
MHESTRSVLRFHVASMSWLALTLGIAWAALGPTQAVLSGVTMSAELAAAVALAIGLATGSLAARLLWVSIPVRHAHVASGVRRPSVLAATGSTARP